MILDIENILLFIEPVNIKSEIPVDDELTLTMERLLEKPLNTGVIWENGKFLENYSTKGLHQCCCGEKSRSYDFEIYPKTYTNSLATHYLRWHREEVPEKELDKVKKLCSYLK